MIVICVSIGIGAKTTFNIVGVYLHHTSGLPFSVIKGLPCFVASFSVDLSTHLDPFVAYY